MGSQGYDVCNDTIFVTGLPEDTTDEQLAEYFGQIGIIKYDKKNECKKIWIYKDKASGKGKGEATITYDDPPTATSAIQWFDGKEFRGSKLKIELAQRKSAPQYSRGGGGGFRGGRGGYDRGGGAGGGRPGGGSGSSGRPGDWMCPTCSNNNFAYRQECNRCKTQKPPSAGSGVGNDNRGSGGGGSHYNGSGGGRHRGDNYPSSRSSGYRDEGGMRDRGGTDNRDRDRDRDRDSYRDRDGHRERDRDRDRDRDGGSRGGPQYYTSGPSRSSMQRSKDDRRQRPY